MYFLVRDLKSGVVTGEEAAVMFSHRLGAGEKIVVTDLAGSNANAVVEKYDKVGREYYLKVGIIEKLEIPAPFVLIQSIIDKQYLDKLVEVIGYSHYTDVILIVTEHSQPTTVDLDRLTKIMMRSSLLSQRSSVPALRLADTTLEELVIQYKPVVLDVSGSTSKHTAEAVLVGPEGGFADSEYQIFDKHHLSKQSLGSNIYPGWLAGFVANV